MTPPLRPALFRDGRYVRIWLIGWATGIVRWLDLLAWGIFAFELTGSPLMVAVIALTRFLPMALLSLPFGAAADVLSPRKVLFWALVSVVAITVAMLAAHLTTGLAYWHLVVGGLVSGVFWASDMPLRRKMIGEIAGPDRLAQAMSFDYATSNGTRLFGPLIGGVVYQSVGMGGVLCIGLALYVAATVMAAGIRPTGGKRGGTFDPWKTLLGAARSARRAVGSNDVGCILAVTVIFNLWGFPFVSMIPVIGDEVLKLSPSIIGYVASIEGAMSLVSVLLVGFFARPVFYRRLYYSAVVLHLVSVGFIGLFPGLVTLCVGLAVAGFVVSGFSAMQATLIYTVAPRGMRGRYLGLMSICIGAGLIGFANVGLMAELFGAQAALVIIALEGMVAILALGTRWRALRQELGIARPG